MEKDNQSQVLQSLRDKVSILAINIEKMKLAEYVRLLDNPWRLMYINFIAGLARGLGIAVGFTILGAIILHFLKALMILNLPWIGDFIAEIVRLVYLKTGI